ncbi:MAG: retroviral-like aspartic protease family protein, partial [Alistipes sp.]|nr:retroviral-like aspartic protease family protein [Alistipes sp.]
VLPCTIEYGKYIVEVGTPAGPRRFVFDTGASRTVVSERLCREAGIAPAGASSAGDFEGYRAQVATARIPALTIGDATYRNCPVDVLPDSSYV